MLNFDDLIAKIARPSHRLNHGARLVVAGQPKPFVSPRLQPDQGDVVNVNVEVIFIEAPAAVGKSTLARAISSKTGAPLLDLTKVPVSTQSLVGLLHADCLGSTNPVEAFQRGDLPLVVDALDEGRLLSGEQSFEQFLETTAELLLASRHVADRPKLVFLGRPDSIELTKLGLQMAGEGFTHSLLRVAFFDHETACELIEAYASLATDRDSAYVQHPEPRKRLVDAYFNAIESALGLSTGQLWTTEEGRAFAGYAPVLAALGSLLAKFENFVDVMNALQSKGVHNAWSVIETVLQTILTREQRQLTDQLRKRISTAIPSEAYDSHEQLTLLSHVIHGYKLPRSTRVNLPDADLRIYEEMVMQRLPEHPFIRDGEPANDVLGSIIVAHAIYNNLPRLGDNSRLGPLSRQPFVWRSLSATLQDELTLLDGRHFGYVLNSHWNDPVRTPQRVVVRSTSENSTAVVSLPTQEHRPLMLEVVLPLWLYGQLRDCSIEVNGSVKLLGETASGAGGTFAFRDKVEILCETLDVEADVVVLEGKTWLEAVSVNSRPRLELRVGEGAEVGWGGALPTAYPWNRQPNKASAPYSVPPQNVLEALLAECSHRLSAGAPITLTPAYKNPNDDRLRWIDRQFQSEFADLIGLMVKFRLASTEPLSAKGDPKVMVRFAKPWTDIDAAMRIGSSDSKLAAFVKEAKELIK
jgi:hypothetical protein